MRRRCVLKFYEITPDLRVGKWIHRTHDVRTYQPRTGWRALVEMPLFNPVTDEPITGNEWWIYIARVGTEPWLRS